MNQTRTSYFELSLSALSDEVLNTLTNLGAKLISQYPEGTSVRMYLANCAVEFHLPTRPEGQNAVMPTAVVCPECKVPVPTDKYVEHYHDHVVLAGG